MKSEMLRLVDAAKMLEWSYRQKRCRSRRREPSREPAKQAGSKPAPGHPWLHGYEQRMKLQRLNRSQESALVGVSACATP
jgi:hypothetical protein